ncbi:AzlD domain-containing protein [Sinomonas susongensis]|uniref:AzlD domain-containing protein n=1 Tax=Sinomonas susongensis TaxID=1324851 RepID=UPI001108AEE8|nr:AzlD domain-containing protein [Sinomonas susongensis]
MNLWFWVVASCAAAYAIKLLGYLVPRRWMENERMTRVAGTVTIGLLASLTAVNTFASGQSFAFDARVGSLVAAAVALILRAPFLVVVIVGAAVAAGLRLLGWG